MKAPDRNGFTLLELLLAISLLSLITGAILGGLHLGRRAWEASRASESLDEVENTLRAVTTLFSRAVPVAIASQDASTGQILFAGAPNVCRFIILSEGGANWGGLLVAEIGGEAAGEESVLAVWTRVYRPDTSIDAPRETMTRAVALKDLVSFQLTYFGSAEPGKPAVWSDKWEKRIALPQLIGVKLSARRLGRVIEASATVALRQQ